MVATVSNGLSNVSLVNDNTGFSVWKRDGTGGTPSAISEVDVFLQGTGACSVKVSNQGIVLAYGTGGLDLSAAGTHVYIWVNMLAGGLMANRASNGLCVCLSSDATLTTGSNYSFWAVDGADTYPGGWVRYVVDISKTRTTGAGTLNTASVQYIGMYCDTRPNTAKFDNLVIDRIDYAVAGTGLSVYGTSTTDDTFGDILAADEGTVNNKYGVITSKAGVYYVRGTIELGDDAGTNACDLTDIDKVVVFETPTYYNGTDVVQAVSDTFNQLKIVGNGTGSTTVQMGKKVGTGSTASGRNGNTFIETGAKVTMDFDDGNSNAVKIYGTAFQGITGGLSWGTNTAHECIGNSFSGCTQFNPVGGIIIKDCAFVNTASTTGALLWNNNIDIENCNFIANTVGEGTEHTSINSVYTGSSTNAAPSATSLELSGGGFSANVAVNDYAYNETDGSYAKVTVVTDTVLTTEALTGGTDNTWTSGDAFSISPAVTYTDLVFSGNTSDVTNSATGSDALFISKTGTSNPATSTGTAVFIGSVSLTVFVVDTNNNGINTAEIAIYASSDGTQLLLGTSSGGGTGTPASVSGSYTGSTPANVIIRARKNSPADSPRYINYSTTGTISASGLSVTIVMQEDNIA